MLSYTSAKPPPLLSHWDPPIVGHNLPSPPRAQAFPIKYESGSEWRRISIQIWFGKVSLRAVVKQLCILSIILISFSFNHFRPVKTHVILPRTKLAPTLTLTSANFRLFLRPNDIYLMSKRIIRIITKWRSGLELGLPDVWWYFQLRAADNTYVPYTISFLLLRFDEQHLYIAPTFFTKLASSSNECLQNI